uniref:Uncharacterized protein n=1 Tax=Rhizophora mucronata TaxID=61149 RepID=A0A2P2Q819_RHIMU
MANFAGLQMLLLMGIAQPSQIQVAEQSSAPRYFTGDSISNPVPAKWLTIVTHKLTTPIYYHFPSNSNELVVGTPYTACRLTPVVRVTLPPPVIGPRTLSGKYPVLDPYAIGLAAGKLLIQLEYPPSNISTRVELLYMFFSSKTLAVL